MAQTKFNIKRYIGTYFIFNVLNLIALTIGGILITLLFFWANLPDIVLMILSALISLSLMYWLVERMKLNFLYFFVFNIVFSIALILLIAFLFALVI